MKLAFIGGFERLYDEEGKAKSFEKIGCDVLRIPENAFAESDIDKIISYQPDVIISAKYVIRDDLRDKLFSVAKEKNITTIAWHPDLYHYPSLIGKENRLATITNKVGPYSCDYVFSPDGCLDSKKLYNKCGINHYTIRQAPYHETVGKYSNADISDIVTREEIPILFVGELYNAGDPFRSYLLSLLDSKYGRDFCWLGKSEHQVREERLSTVISRTKIVIGESAYFPGYWSNRIYESIGRGGLTIHPYVPGLEEEFEDGKECIFFNRWNFEDLFSKIDYYLDKANGNERESIIEKGIERVREDHTLLNRCNQIMDILNGF